MAVIFMDGFDHTDGLESISYIPKWNGYVDSEAFYPNIFADVPGSTGWTIAQVNALEAGYELDS